MTKQENMTKQEFMAFSLPYGLKCKELGLNEIFTLNPKLYSLIELLNWSNAYQPLLRPLSDLNKPIEHKGEKFIPLHKLLEVSNFDLSKMSEREITGYMGMLSTPYLINICDLPLYLQWHFDLFGGIESGEAIDVNTLEINPYK
jgi:hypothetical protein